MIILVMGVAGSGKSTVGQRLADALKWQFKDADAFHPIANVEKMRQGIPLTEADRLPWLQALQQVIYGWLQTDTNAVLACSALKSSYRDFLYQSCDRVKVVYLKGTPELLQQRLSRRQGHFMTAALLQSQLSTLEEPENALLVNISLSPDEIVEQIRRKLGV